MAGIIGRAAGGLIRSLRRSAAYAELRDDFIAHLKRSALVVPEGGSLEQLQQEVFVRFAAPGHYYSPIPSYAEIARDQERIFATGLQDVPGVTIDAQRFRERIAAFAPLQPDFPYGEERDGTLRFHLDNPTYSRGDAVVLYAMMRLHRPRRIIEVGSGRSTWLMLDVNERFLGNEVELATVDPHPDLMLEGLHRGDRDRLEILPVRVQDVDPARFAALAAGDILFVDSTHVTRCDSDVNHLFFTILPCLAPGVLVHFHDMFWPFEYPKQWLLELGVAWNELYLMRAFLQYNRAFELDFFSDYAAQFLREELQQAVPVFLGGPGSSLWLKRVS